MLGHAEHRIMPDRIETGTYLTAAAITGGELFIRDTAPDKLEYVIKLLEDMGCIIKCGADSIYIDAPKNTINPKEIFTAPYPLFPTDMQPQMAVLLTLVDGQSTITENVWEDRFLYVKQLAKMGAKIDITQSGALIHGSAVLQGTLVEACDLRAGAAMIIAGLVASGQTAITDIRHIERGYDDIAGKLRGIGADIFKN